MKRTILKITVCALFAAPLLSRGQTATNNMAAPAAVAAQPAPPVIAVPPAEMPATNAPVKPKPRATSPAVTGKASNVDTNAMTLTVGKRTYDITSETRITKGGKPAILSDIAVDEKVGVTYKKVGDKFDALTISVAKAAEKSGGEAKSTGGQK